MLLKILLLKVFHLLTADLAALKPSFVTGTVLWNYETEFDKRVATPEQSTLDPKILLIRYSLFQGPTVEKALCNWLL